MKKQLTLLIALLIGLFTYATPALAAAPHLYQVEVIVFTTLNKNALSQEQWPPIYSASFQDPKASDLNYNGTAPFAVLPSNDWMLNHEGNALARDPNTHVVMHLAWLQPRGKRTVHIIGGTAFDANGNAIAVSPGDANIPADTRWEVNGLLTLTLMKFADADDRFLLAEPAGAVRSLSAAPLRNITRGLAYFRLNDQRRMKMGELNYIDGPVYGVLIKVVPR